MADAYAWSSTIRPRRSAPTYFETLVSCRAASTRTHRAVSSSRVMVTLRLSTDSV